MGKSSDDAEKKKLKAEKKAKKEKKEMKEKEKEKEKEAKKEAKKTGAAGAAAASVARPPAATTKAATTAAASSIKSESKENIKSSAVALNTDEFAVSTRPAKSAGGGAGAAKTMADFDVLSKLGTGSFGRVYLVRDKASQEVYAMKQIEKVIAKAMKQVEHVFNEKAALQRFASPFVTSLAAAFVSNDSLFMVLDYCAGGEMFTWLRRAKKFDKTRAVFYAAQVVLALEHIHSKGTLYRDMKPENALFDADGYVKLVDFGFAKQLSSDTDKTWTLCGTPEYMAPELILSKGHAYAADWWSFGVLVYEMLAGFAPFQAADQISLYREILLANAIFPDHFSDDACDLIEGLLQLDQTRRLGCMHAGVAEIKAHAFFQSVDWRALAARELEAPWRPPVKAIDDTSCFVTIGQNFNSRKNAYKNVSVTTEFDDW